MAPSYTLPTRQTSAAASSLVHLSNFSINLNMSRTPAHLHPIMLPLSFTTSTGSQFNLGLISKYYSPPHKVIYNLAPPYLSDLLHLHTSTHCLRSTDTHTHTQNPQDQALHLGLQGLLSHSLWNSLPDHNRPAKTLPSVKPSKPTSLRTLSPQNFLSFPPLSSFLILFYFLLNLYLTR